MTGLKVTTQLTRSSDYTAVFVIPTPAFDDSGLSHLVEHMVFRGCDKYPASHELYIINSLLPASINASTQNGFTVYFATSTDKQVFNALIDYLYHCLQQREYVESELILERDGVITNELALLAQNAELAELFAIWRGDHSEQRYPNAGGYLDTIKTNTLSALIAYKANFYHESNISLYIDAPELIDKTWLSWESSPFDVQNTDKQASPSPLTTKKPLDLDEQRLVVTWWIHGRYLQGIKPFEADLNSAIKEDEKLLIEEALNPHDLFALRLISANFTREQHNNAQRYECESATILGQKLQSLEIEAQTYEFATQKHSEVLAKIITNFLSENKMLGQARPFSEYVQTPYYSHPSQQASHTPTTINCKAVEHQSMLAQRLSNQLSLDHLPSLPKLLQPLADMTCNNETFISNENHWVLRVKRDKHEQLLKSMLNPEFWLPRLNGECYAMGVACYNDHVFIYAAQDCKVDSRFQTPII